MADSISIEVRVHYPDCDPMGVVHHGVYPLWFEQARTELLRSTGVAYADLEAAGLFMVVIDLKVRYLKPARYDQLLQVTARCTRAKGVRIEHEYEVRHEGLILATGSTTLACLDAEGRPCQVPESIGIVS